MANTYSIRYFGKLLGRSEEAREVASTETGLTQEFADREEP